MNSLITCILFLFACNSFGFVPTKTEYNRALVWKKSSLTLPIVVNTNKKNNSTNSISQSDIQSIVNESASEWSANSQFNLSVSYDNFSSSFSQNTIEFSDDGSYFGSGVLAVTSLNHSASTGEIYSANILINDSGSNFINFSNNKSQTNSINVYLGDVLVHEFGHFLGLGHSDVFGATMGYSVFKGQHTVHDDDINGVRSSYGVIAKAGRLSGKIVGGQLVGVFGAQVQAISMKSGKVITGVLSDQDGNFEIKNLNTDDSYLVYILPPRGIEHLPSYYASIQTNYCGGRPYAPSFFTKCGGSEKGKPQVINLSSQNKINLGNISIKCDEGIRPDYLFEKTQDIRDEIVIHESGRNINENISEVFQGYFSNSEIESSDSNIQDKLRIDFRNFSVPLDGTYYLEVKVINSEIGSAFKLAGTLEGENGTIFKSYQTDAIGLLITDLAYQVPLSTDQSENNFLLTLEPSISSSLEKNGMFGNYKILSNKNSTYLVLTSVKKMINGQYQYIGLKDSYPYEDNTYCTEADVTFTSRANIIGSNAESNASQSSDEEPSAQGLSCGTIDIDDNDGPGGMASFSLGILLIFMISSITRKSHDFFV